MIVNIHIVRWVTKHENFCKINKYQDLFPNPIKIPGDMSITGKQCKFTFSCIQCTLGVNNGLCTT